MTNLEVKEDGLIYVDGILVSDQEKARELLFLKHCIFPKEIALKQATGIYPIPDLQWEVDDSHNPEKQGYTYGGGYAADMMAYNGPVAILKESKPLPHGSKCIMQDESIPFVEAHQLRSAEEIAYATWRKLVNQNWANVAGEIQTAIEEYAEGVEQELKAKFKSHSPIEQKADYEYEMFFDDDGPINIHGWLPIATDRIKNPEKIPHYLEIGLLRRKSQPLPIEGEKPNVTGIRKASEYWRENHLNEGDYSDKKSAKARWIKGG